MTRPAHLFGMTARLSVLLGDLDKMGIRVEIGDDFSRYRHLRTQQADRGGLYPMFDIGSSYVDRTNGFWVCGFNPEGDLIHTQAVRLLDLSGVSLATHLADHRRKYITPGSTPDPDQTVYAGPRALETITGKVCYHGDFWLHARGLGGPRGQGTTALLSRILLEIMIESWSPSFVFALVPKKLAEKGVQLRYGYDHCAPGRWLGPSGEVTEEEYLIWMGVEDMADLVQRAPQRVQPPAPRNPVAEETAAADRSEKAIDA